MKYKKRALTLILGLILISISNTLIAQNQTYEYAYILIEGRAFSKKLKVTVDFGDAIEQLKSGKEFSKILNGKKSYAAILNYMVEKDFELIETLDYNSSYQGSGGTTGIAFIMRKTRNQAP